MSDPIKISDHSNPSAASAIRDTSSQDVVKEKSSAKKKWPWLVAIMILVAVAAAVYPNLSQWFDTERSIAKQQLRFSTVQQMPFSRDISAQGVVVAAISPTIYATSAGTVTISARAGDQVSEGDPIAIIDSPELNNELQREQATLNSLETNLQRQAINNKKDNLTSQQSADLAKIRLTAAERELRRAEASWAHKVISLQDLEKAKDDLEQARYELDHAKRAAALDKESLGFELATLRLERDRQKLMVNNLLRRVDELQLRAPVDGMVSTLAVDRKAFVPVNAAIATIIDLSALEIDLSISDSYADDLVLGTEVSIKFAGQTYSATLVSVSPEVVNGSVTGRVRFEQEQPAGLRQNQRVSARIILETKDQALLVERGPFYDTGGGRLIYRVRDNVAERIEIITGSTSVSYIEILQGLQIGDEVVISEIDKFKNAERVLLRN